MSDMTEQEAWELDELLTKTIPEVSPTVEGPFIKHRELGLSTFPDNATVASPSA
jgi:hypothetical protein